MKIVAWVVPWLALMPAAARCEDLTKAFESYMDARVRVSQFSGSVLVAREGQVVFRRGYGLANREWGVPNTPETKFRLGSITKQFTAMAVLILQEQGKLKVEAPIKTYLADCPESWDAITIRHLLTHTSGIPNFTGFPDYQKTMREPSPPLKTIARFRDKPLEFAPGTKFAYSNSGYVLLGALIEKVSGKSYEAVLRESILEPLGMADTGYDHTETVLEKRASGYEADGDRIVNADYLDMTIPHAAGALYSTVDDLFKWDRALAAGKLVSADSYKALFTPFQGGYAYGWVVAERFGRKTIGHGGGINGFVTAIDRFPDDQACVIVLCNATRNNPGTIVRDLAAILFGESYELPRKREEIAVAEDVLRRYAGRYQLAPDTVLVLEVDQGRLLGAPEGQAKVRLRADSTTTFFIEEIDARVEFVKDEQGKVTHLLLRQGERERKAERVTGAPAPSSKPCDPGPTP